MKITMQTRQQVMSALRDAVPYLSAQTLDRATTAVMKELCGTCTCGVHEDGIGPDKQRCEVHDRDPGERWPRIGTP